MSGPVNYIQDRPNPNTPTLGGEPIDMRRLAEDHGFNYTSLSKVFNGTRTPSPRFAKAIAEALGLTRGEFYALLDHKFPR